MRSSAILRILGAAAVLAAGFIHAAIPAGAATPTRNELLVAHRWAEAELCDARSGPPFSFVYGGKPSASLLPGWRVVRRKTAPDRDTILRTLTYTDPSTRLEVRCSATEYADFPAVEWVVTFRNLGAHDTPLIEDVRSADLRLSTTSGDFTLHYADGSHNVITDFHPRERSLPVGAELSLAPEGGRSSDGVLPFFNVERPGGGVMLAVGWSGQWAAAFRRNDARTLRYRAGMERTHLILRPGEQIRTPSTLMLCYQGDALRGHNLLRALLLRHYSPRIEGKPVDPPVAASGATIGFNNVTEENQIQAIRNIAAHKLPIDTYWIDAGWSVKGFPEGMGTWDPEPSRFPNGLKPVADAAHEAGYRFLLWCEPERVMPGTWLRRTHTDWLRKPANLPPQVAYQYPWRLLDLGNPEALAWAKRTFSGLIGSVGIDIYRQDFNMHPLYYWRAGEPPDRQGMNEIRHITGLYDYLDTLRRDHPRLMIDDVASGGRRIDIEWLRRSLPLLRTDYLWDPVGAQSMTYALSFWAPLHGQGAVLTDPYDFRSGMGSNASFAFDFYHMQADFWQPLAERIEEFRKIRHLFRGDFYPLTPYSTADDVWIAWQFDRPDLGEGMIQAFRRAGNKDPSIHVRLAGLKPTASYVLTLSDSQESRTMSGRELMSGRLDISLPAPRSSVTLRYRIDRAQPARRRL
jgi:alpha-galactosidase